jgi:hypothetical protein
MNRDPFNNWKRNPPEDWMREREPAYPVLPFVWALVILVVVALFFGDTWMPLLLEGLR